MRNLTWDGTTPLTANWELLRTENATLYAQLKPHINRDGAVKHLPYTIAEQVLRFVLEQREKQQAAQDAAKAQTDLEARRKAVQDAVEAERKALYNNPQRVAEAAALEKRLAFWRLESYAEERGLARVPENAKAVAEWLKAQKLPLTEQNIDKAIEALSSQLQWEGFAAKLRA